MVFHSVSLLFRCIEDDSYSVVTRLAKDGKVAKEEIETNLENVGHFKKDWEENWNPKIELLTKGFWARYLKYLKSIEVDAISQHLE